jgi:hypothetical protein
MKTKTFLTAIMLTVFIGTIPILGQYTLNKNVISNGGTIIENSYLKLNGTLGQPIIGINSNSLYFNRIGFWYQINAVTTDIEKNIFELPESFKLYQNYPNPFYLSTTIKYSIPKASTEHSMLVRLEIYDILGMKVVTLINEQQQPGTYYMKWNKSNNLYGVYIYKLVVSSTSRRANIFTKTKRMILLH